MKRNLNLEGSRRHSSTSLPPLRTTRTAATHSLATGFSRRLGRAPSVLPALLALALTLPILEASARLQGPPQIGWDRPPFYSDFTDVTLYPTLLFSVGETTTCFEWGTTTNYGNSDCGTMYYGPGMLPFEFHEMLSLVPGIIYHFCFTASNDYGTTSSGDGTIAARGEPPQVTTLPATDITTNSATLNGSASAILLPPAAWFQWGTTTDYGNLISATDTGNGTISAQLAGLTTGTTYHFQAVASNSWGVVYGSDQSFTPGLEFTFMTNNGALTITEYTGLGGAVTIPDTIDGLPVTSIGGYLNINFGWSGAFFQCASVTSVTIPNSVTNLGGSAFQECTGLTNVTIGNGVTCIGDLAFYYCTSLANITIPNGVTKIGGTAFDACTSLTRVTIPNNVTDIGDDAFILCTSLTNVAIGIGVTNLGEDVFADCTSLAVMMVDPLNPAYCSADGVLFDKSQTTLIQYPGGKAGAYTIPTSVTNIGSDAFNGCTRLTNVNIPGSVANIGLCAFRSCGSLTHVTISEGVTNIGPYAFAECYGLTTVTLPSSVTRIEDYAFDSCTSLTSIYAKGNAPLLGDQNALFVFIGDNKATVYYLPGTTGWGYFGGLPTVLWQQPLPEAWTLSASSIAPTAATLNGTVNPNGSLAAGWFQWGTTTYYGNLTPATGMGSGTNALPLSAPLAGLTPGSTYHYRVVATNSPYVVCGSDQSFTTLGAVLVSTLPATAVSTNTATLNGTVNPNGWPTTAWFQWGATTSYGNLTSMTALGSGTTAMPLSAPLARLTPSFTYHFRVAATNDYGLAYGSDQSFIALGPPEVWTLAATAVTATNAMLNGTVNPNGHPTAAWFQWGNTTRYGNLTTATDMGSGTTSLLLSAPLAGLTPSTTYHFRAAATESAGVVYGSDQSLTTGSFPVPFTDADWVSLGSGMNDSVNALAVSGTILYAGGVFTKAGGVAANFIAKWDGHNWSALGSGMDNGVTSLAVIGTNLYAGGYFATAGGVPALYIAKWDGSAWSSLDALGRPEGLVRALAVSGTNLYVGGHFSGITKWDGRTWSVLSSGIGDVNALVVSGTDLYAGGSFTNAGGVRAKAIAKWDGRVWSALGSGLAAVYDPSVAALALSGTNLYAAGYIEAAGGVQAHGIAKWDGSAWSDLDWGMDFYGVDALAVSGTDLYAGGIFSAAGGVPTKSIAKWNGSAWSALGSGMDSAVFALAADGAGHLFVGGAFGLAGTKVSHYIAQANVGSAPTVLAAPQSQTAEAGATVILSVHAAGNPSPVYQWCCNGTCLVSSANPILALTDILFSQSGTYAVVVTNVYGAVTSAPALVNVIPAVERRPVPGVIVTGETASLVNVDYADSLSRAPTWTPLGSVSLTNTPQYCCDPALPLSPQRFYRAWQAGTPGVRPSLDLHLVPAITLTGAIGHSVRVDCINQSGPTDAWVTLATVPLTNTSQLYFDISAPGQPPRLYRLVPSP